MLKQNKIESSIKKMFKRHNISLSVLGFDVKNIRMWEEHAFSKWVLLTSGQSYLPIAFSSVLFGTENLFLSHICCET